jgi:3-oxoacyl-[acyl-carrier protein] reductase
MVARVVPEWGRVDVLVANAGGGRGRPMDTKASTLDPALLQLVTERTCSGPCTHATPSAAAFREDHHGKFGRRYRPICRWRLCPLWGGEGRYRPLHAISGAGSRAVRDHGELHRPGVIATGRIMATVIPGSIQSNRDRAELVALRRLGTVEDCAKVVEFLSTDLSDYVTGAVIPIDGGLVRG